MHDRGGYHSRYGDGSRFGRFFCGALCCGIRPRISADHRGKRNDDNIHRNGEHPHDDFYHTADIGFCGQQQYDRDKHHACFCIGNDLADGAANDLIFGNDTHDLADSINAYTGDNAHADNCFLCITRHDIVNGIVCNFIDIAFCGDDFDDRIYHTDHIVRLDEYDRRNDRDNISGYAAGRRESRQGRE